MSGADGHRRQRSRYPKPDTQHRGHDGEASYEIMTPVAALHTAARRYCIERADMWRKHYVTGRVHRESEAGYPPGMYSYVPEDYAVFPRYNVLDAILWEVERTEPENIPTLGQLRDLILTTGRTAESLFTRPPNDAVELQAMNDERRKFCMYVAELTADELRALQVLPYRRVLQFDESERLWAGLAERWGVDGDQWYPFISDDLPSDVIAFQERWFKKHVPSPTLRELLATRRVERLWELREGGSGQGLPEYEIELGLLEPIYDGRCGFWTSGTMDWLVHVTHESSITVGGEWLLNAIRSGWPAWREHVYGGWDYDGPG